MVMDSETDWVSVMVSSSDGLLEITGVTLEESSGDAESETDELSVMLGERLMSLLAVDEAVIDEDKDFVSRVGVSTSVSVVVGV